MVFDHVSMKIFKNPFLRLVMVDLGRNFSGLSFSFPSSDKNKIWRLNANFHWINHVPRGTADYSTYATPDIVITIMGPVPEVPRSRKDH